MLADTAFLMRSVVEVGESKPQRLKPGFLGDSCGITEVVPSRYQSTELSRLNRFEAMHQPHGSGYFIVQVRPPQAQDLRALVDAFEARFGFRNRFYRRDPKFIGTRRVQRGAHALPAVFQAQHRSGERSGVAQILRALRRFEKAIVGAGRQEVDDRLDAQANRPRERTGNFDSDVATQFAAHGGGTEQEAFRDGHERRVGAIGGVLGNTLAETEIAMIGR